MSCGTDRLWTVATMTLNVVSVVSIVILNKKLFGSEVGFSFPNTLLAFHLVATTVGVVLYQRAGGFELPETPPSFRTTVPIAIYQVLSIVFVNYSLYYNSVGFYQILKLANIPAICIAEYFWKGTVYTTRIKMALSLLVMGIGVTTVTCVSVNPWGLFHGILAILTSVLLQLGVKDLSKGLTNEQSCYYVSPVSAILLTINAFLFDDLAKLQDFTYTTGACILLGLSGLAAFCINLTLFIIIGKTSPVTYQVVGHLKTLLVLVGGFLFFNAPTSSRNILGMGIAMGGVMWYTYEKLYPSPVVSPLSPRGQEEDATEPREQESDKELVPSPFPDSSEAEKSPEA